MRRILGIAAGIIAHALFAWTVYILVGSYLKDERLAYYLRDRYRAYQSRVAGYPWVPAGPLGKRVCDANSPPLPLRDSVPCTPSR